MLTACAVVCLLLGLGVALMYALLYGDFGIPFAPKLQVEQAVSHEMVQRLNQTALHQYHQAIQNGSRKHFPREYGISFPISRDNVLRVWEAEENALRQRVPARAAEELAALPQRVDSFDDLIVFMDAVSEEEWQLMKLRGLCDFVSAVPSPEPFPLEKVVMYSVFHGKSAERACSLINDELGREHPFGDFSETEDLTRTHIILEECPELLREVQLQVYRDAMNEPATRARVLSFVSKSLHYIQTIRESCQAAKRKEDSSARKECFKNAIADMNRKRALAAFVLGLLAEKYYSEKDYASWLMVAGRCPMQPNQLPGRNTETLFRPNETMSKRGFSPVHHQDYYFFVDFLFRRQLEANSWLKML